MTAIILSNTINPTYFIMLRECVNSILLSDIQEIIVVETNANLKNKHIELPKTRFIFPCESFNYNKFLNIGISNTTDTKLLLSNNDVVYTPNCIDKLNDALNLYDSVSPCDTDETTEFTEGYDVETILKGWSIGVNRHVIEKMGGFDEQFIFWYQDNDYANTLKQFNFLHARVNNARAIHKYQQSHTLLENAYNATHGSTNSFLNKWT